MTIILIFLVLLLASIFALFSYKKSSLVTLIIACLSYWLVGSGLVATFLTANLIPSAHPQINWKNSNVIIVLGAGGIVHNHLLYPAIFSYPRTVTTAQLYFDCKKAGKICKILATGGIVDGTNRTEAGVFGDFLEKLNVPKQDILLEQKSQNTYENAAFTKEILKNEHTEQFILVTSGIHMPRSQKFFRHFGMPSIGFASDFAYPRLSIVPSAYNFAVTDMAIHEYRGMVEYFLRHLREK